MQVAVLIVLFWIVFAIVGMNVFGTLTLDLTYLGIQVCSPVRPLSPLPP